MSEIDDLLTQAELCQWLKITSMTAYRWRERGMPYIGKGKGIRYKKSDVEQWLENQKTQK